MTKRLEDAIKHLTPEQVEVLTHDAEAMGRIPPGVRPGDPAKMNWVGCLKDSPWRTGLEAQKAANTLRIAL